MDERLASEIVKEDSIRGKLVRSFVGTHPLVVVEALVIWAQLPDCPPKISAKLETLRGALAHCPEFTPPGLSSLEGAPPFTPLYATACGLYEEVDFEGPPPMPYALVYKAEVVEELLRRLEKYEQENAAMEWLGNESQHKEAELLEEIAQLKRENRELWEKLAPQQAPRCKAGQHDFSYSASAMDECRKCGIELRVARLEEE